MVRKRQNPNQNQFQTLNAVPREIEQEQSGNSVMNANQNDNTGMILVTAVFNSENYLAWSKSNQRDLIAKEEINFILKDDATPEENFAGYQNWRKIDCLVTSWILNSVSKDFAEAFLHTTTSRSLWKELAERFGGSNGPRLFQLKSEINMLQQGNYSIMIYYTKLKKLWDELDLLKVYPNCQCGIRKNCVCNIQSRIVILMLENMTQKN